MAGIDTVPDPMLYPFQSRWFESSKGRLHYIDEGEGKTIVFCHGNPTWSFLYRNIVRSLTGTFRCVAMDYLGFGLSERPPGYGYTAAEHAAVVGELIDHLKLDDFLLMGQDWGGPIGLSAAADRSEQVSGLILGNTWFWPTVEIPNVLFSKMMSSPPFQWLILRRNFFVERVIPAASARRLSDQEMDHYRRAQPDPASRKGVAEFPKQLLAARDFLSNVEGKVIQRLSSKRVLLVWGMKDVAFRAKAFLPRFRKTFHDHVLVELARAKHFIQEDAPDEIAKAIMDRFGQDN